MAYKTILTVLTAPDDVALALNNVLPFVAAQGAHLDVLCLGIDRTQTGYYFAGATALMHDATIAQAQAEATQVEKAARDILAQHDVTWGVEALVAQSASVAPLVARRARFADLVMLPKPYGEGQPADAPIVVESAMFQGQAPALVLADGASVPVAPKHAVIAWNESAEAMASIRRALPLLMAAEKVSVVMVAPERHSPDSADPGSELSKLLSRHGVAVEVVILPQTLTRVSEVIARFVADQSGDLLVMGAYGHSRFREAILGGATRNMLEHAKVPVFMAH
jgi:nucleotide-binding universal stress UspA family protein